MSVDLAGLGTLTLGSLAMLALAALLIGFAKTAVGGVAMISVAIFAAVLPSRISTGVALGLLLVGDVVAVRLYRTHADWRTLLKLLPAVGIGLLVGVVFMARVDDALMRKAIGVIVLALIAIQLVLQRHPVEPNERQTTVARWGFGSLAGFTTMVANAGGSAMSLYLLFSRYSMLAFLGTSAWFFLLVNLAKVPFSIGLGLITPSTLLLDAALVPAVLLGTWIGRRTINHLNQKTFNNLVLITTAISAGYLML